MTRDPEKLNFALPDGHLMTHVVPFLKGAGLSFEGYDFSNLNRRPTMGLATDLARKGVARPDLVAVRLDIGQDPKAVPLEGELHGEDVHAGAGRAGIDFSTLRKGSLVAEMAPL